MCNERILCAGFGGQGVMSLGQLLAYAGMAEDKNVTWIPSYGPEMRGGTAYCSVVVSTCEVGSPIVTSNASCAIIMNFPSLIKFENSIISGGDILINSSLIDKQVERPDLHAYYIDAEKLAVRAGNKQAANIVMLGAYLGLKETVRFSSIENALAKVFGKKTEDFMRVNREALFLGAGTILEADIGLEAA